MAQSRWCCTCGDDLPEDRKSAKCRECHAAYMREWRKTHPPTEEQRRRDNARSYLGVYLRRGKIRREPCIECGAEPAEGHHFDYDKPLDVVWLCRTHHLQLHALFREPRREDCALCGGANLRLPQRYCHRCHAAYQRAYRAESA